MNKFLVEYVCDNCDFISNNKFNYEKHMKTKKHLRNTLGSKTKIPYYYCKCRRTFASKSNLTRHRVNCMIHNNAIAKKRGVINQYNCECGKLYKNKCHLTRHLKTCGSQINGTDKINTDDILSIVKMITEEVIHNKFTEFLPQMGNTNTINNNFNFNLNIFLHETCKDAITFGDFIKTLQNNVTDELMCNSADIGLMQNVANQIMESIIETDESKRPIHYINRKTHIKVADNEWTDKNTKQIIKNGIEDVGDGHGNFIFEKQDKFLKSIEGVRKPTYKEDDTYLKYSIANTVTLQNQPTKINQVVRDIEKLVKVEL